MVNITQTLSRPGATIRFTDSPGELAPVVFTHGAGMDHAMFSAQADAVNKAGHRVVQWDLRGHGRSTLDEGRRFTADDAMDDGVALLDTLGLERPVLVGHSLGGNLSQALVRREPTRAGGLIMMGSTWNAGPLTALERVGLGVSAPMLSAIPASRLPGLMARASAITPSVVESIRETFARMSKANFLDVWRATVSFVEPDPDYRTPVPLALVRGEQDSTGNIRTAMPRWAAAEGVAENVIPAAGHVLTLDAPDRVSDVCLAVLARWRGEGGGPE